MALSRIWILGGEFDAKTQVRNGCVVGAYGRRGCWGENLTPRRKDAMVQRCNDLRVEVYLICTRMIKVSSNANPAVVILNGVKNLGRY